MDFLRSARRHVVAAASLIISLLTPPAHAQTHGREARLLESVTAAAELRTGVARGSLLLVLPADDCGAALPGDPICAAASDGVATRAWATQRAQSVMRATGGRLVASLSDVAALQSNRGAPPLTTCASTQEFLTAVTVESIVVRRDTNVVRLSQAVFPRDARCAGSASSTDYFVVEGADGAARVVRSAPAGHYSGLRLPPP